MSTKSIKVKSFKSNTVEELESQLNEFLMSDTCDTVISLQTHVINNCQYVAILTYREEIKKSASIGFGQA